MMHPDLSGMVAEQVRRERQSQADRARLAVSVNANGWSEEEILEQPRIRVPHLPGWWFRRARSRPRPA
jgi:hypothetical protein